MIGAFIGNPIGAALSESARGANEVVGISAGIATAAAAGTSISSSVGLAVGSSTAQAVAANQHVTSRNVLNDPVNCVLAGQQTQFRRGHAHFAALRGIFRE